MTTNSKKVAGHRLIKVPKAKAPDDLKLKLENQAKILIDTVLKPAYMTPSQENQNSNYIVDIYSKWQGHYFYFCAQYHLPDPNAQKTTFESKFARLDYVGDVRFNLSYMSQTGKWEKIFIDLTIDECLDAIKNQPFFYP
ncbi:MAG: hypothetical protein QG657_1488 [Acidobacteriota bacterium]|nr:hypothetical protein [Acidobacteriota bacterium]